MNLSDLVNKKIAILGEGTNHQNLIKYLKNNRVKFTVIKAWRKPSDLSRKVLDFDLLFRSPGLPLLSEPIERAREKNITIYSQTKLFFDLCPAQIIGVTGTKGKGTTASLIANILKNAGHTVWLAGNIGQDPFAFLDEIKPEDWVVLELSSFQLQDLHKSPHISVVLNITSEHLDHHKDFAEYLGAKQQMVRYQSGKDMVVLNYDHEVSRNFAHLSPAQVIWDSLETEVNPGCFVKDGEIILSSQKQRESILKVSEVGLVGWFNLENVTAAIAATGATGLASGRVIKKTIQAFKGLPHRLEFVAEIRGVKYYNDSASTTPETAMAAISAFNFPIILIAGGSEKKSDYLPLAKKIVSSPVKALISIGITGPVIAQLARREGFVGKILDQRFANMEQIVKSAEEIAKEGDLVLFSPAAASFDMFANYKQRGKLFCKFVRRLSVHESK